LLSTRFPFYKRGTTDQKDMEKPQKEP